MICEIYFRNFIKKEKENRGNIIRMCIDVVITCVLANIFVIFCIDAMNACDLVVLVVCRNLTSQI